MSFKERLKELREEKGLTQKDFVHELNKKYNLNLSAPTVSYWEQGREPNYDALIKLAKYFECSTDYLLGLEEYKNEEEKTSAILMHNDIAELIEQLHSEDRKSILNFYKSFLEAILLSYPHDNAQKFTRGLTELLNKELTFFTHITCGIYGVIKDAVPESDFKDEIGGLFYEAMFHAVERSSRRIEKYLGKSIDNLEDYMVSQGLKPDKIDVDEGLYDTIDDVMARIKSRIKMDNEFGQSNGDSAKANVHKSSGTECQHASNQMDEYKP